MMDYTQLCANIEKNIEKRVDECMYYISEQIKSVETILKPEWDFNKKVIDFLLELSQLQNIRKYAYIMEGLNQPGFLVYDGERDERYPEIFLRSNRLPLIYAAVDGMMGEPIKVNFSTDGKCTFQYSGKKYGYYFSTFLGGHEEIDFQRFKSIVANRIQRPHSEDTDIKYTIKKFVYEILNVDGYFKNKEINNKFAQIESDKKT